MSSRFKAARLGALLLPVATTLLVAAPPALAATSGEYVGGVDGDGVRIVGHANPVPTSLFSLKLDNDDTQLMTYCVELDVDARLGARMIESPWSAYPDKAEVFAAAPDKVLWILHHSYPSIDLTALSETIKAELTEREAIAGTQAAIWHFSNDATLDADNPEDIRKLYDYLTGEANTGIGEQPPVSLSLTPETVSDVEAGVKAGPFTVDSTAADVQLTVEGPDGVQLVDGSGQQVEPLDKDIFGMPVQPLDKDIFSVQEFWLTAPSGGAAGEAIIRATALATVELGRLFVGEDNDENPTQTLIVASSTPTEATAEARASWIAAPAPPASTTTPPAQTTTQVVAPTTDETTTAPAPQPRAALPVTGASVLPILAVGVLLIGAGAGVLLLQRKLRRTG